MDVKIVQEKKNGVGTKSVFIDKRGEDQLVLVFRYDKELEVFHHYLSIPFGSESYRNKFFDSIDRRVRNIEEHELSVPKEIRNML